MHKHLILTFLFVNSISNIIAKYLSAMKCRLVDIKYDCEELHWKMYEVLTSKRA